ncbi:MAG: superinfection immunity protein [Ignavibacteriales bacterium]
MHVIDLVLKEAATFGAREWAIVAVGLVWYLMPTIVAFIRKSPHKYAILALNFFLGWSGLGWLIMMLWAVFGKNLIPNFKEPNPPQ